MDAALATPPLRAPGGPPHLPGVSPFLPPLAPMLPDRLFIRALLLRSVGYWAGARLIAAGALGYLLGTPLAVGVLTTLLVTAAAIALAYVEAHRRNELLLMASLGIHPAAVAAVVALPSLGADVAFSLVVG